MTVVYTFGSVTLAGAAKTPTAGKREGVVRVTVKDTVLLSGKHSVQTNVNSAYNETVKCFGTWSDFVALIGLIGTKNTLTISGTPAGTLTYTNCAIGGDISYNDTDNPGYYQFTVKFVQETV
jgi:hypothetical protein